MLNGRRIIQQKMENVMLCAFPAKSTEPSQTKIDVSLEYRIENSGWATYFGNNGHYCITYYL